MAYDNEHKTSAELQREIDMQRSRVEDTIDQIQQKLSPGQLVDELLAYTKGGGGEFVSTLQRQVTANPLPVALLGVSLAWLMAKPASTQATSTSEGDRAWDDSINRRRGYTGVPESTEEEYGDYPVAIISGTSMRRVGHATDAHGRRISRFADDAGKTFHALSDETGRRAGHFVDETGNRFRGFTSAAGERVEHFRDEAGNVIDEAGGWASHTWQRARERLHDLQDAIGEKAGAGRSTAANAAGSMQSQMENLNRTILNQFRDQPLVGGALAFALGAAIGTTIPHTPQEDRLMGEAADALKGKAGEAATELYDKGKEQVADAYASATEKASGLYQQAKDGLTDAVDRVPTGRDSGGNA
ncbi:nutrient deprivation-induced protein [Nostoc sp. 3335mG]|nr:nutrient deprivation-induced protein [Nostoc sp. 3335mG]